MSDVIVVTSGKGGVGKTTTSANIGVGLSALGKHVLIIDTDIGLRNLDVVLGIENQIRYTLVDVIEGRCKFKQALIRDPRFQNMAVLPASQSKNKSSISPLQMKKLIEQIKGDYDYIILDCPAGIEQGFENAIMPASKALIVTTPEVSSIRDADRIKGLLVFHGINDVSLIINRIRKDLIRKGDMMSVTDIIDILGLRLLGTIPDDASVIISTNHGEPVIRMNGQASKAYKNICCKLLPETSKTDKVIVKKPFSRLRFKKSFST